jgi:hypothetical protein
LYIGRSSHFGEQIVSIILKNTRGLMKLQEFFPVNGRMCRLAMKCKKCV